MTTYLVLWKLMVLLILALTSVRTTVATESCWIHADECIIKAEVFQNLEFLSGVPMQIDCFVSSEYEAADIQPDQAITVSSIGNGNEGEDHNQPIMSSSSAYLLRRFMGIQSVMLDGCQTPLNSHTFGLEFLPMCINVTKVSLHHFHMDSLMPLQCGPPESEQQLELEYLLVQNNEISAIDGDSFNGQYPHLRILELKGNSLKAIHGNAFRSLRSLEHLRIVNEPVLMLKSPELFEYTAAIAIHLEGLKHMTSEIFHHLPETVESIFVVSTRFDNDAVEVNNARALINLTLANCALDKFTLCDIHSTVKTINLNGNALTSFEARENSLKELDLSNNKLEHFDWKWLLNLTNLEVLSLRENNIKTLNVNEILQAIPKGRSVDVRANRLQALLDADTELPLWLSTQLRLRCDFNPWDCLWLHEFAHNHPEKFRILQYDKFISKINVNGLECVPAEKPLESNKRVSEPIASGITPPPDKVMNSSSYHMVYGDPYDFRRNQRAEALIIVFMLPVGIAFLFLLLYMWIYCQRMFHVSYYKKFSLTRHPSNVPNPSQRFDVVRQLPPHLQQVDTARSLNAVSGGGACASLGEGSYEVPLNGLCSDCNCKSRPNSLGGCTKVIHITYEESPSEATHQIYEEIIGADGDHDNVPTENGIPKKPPHHITYDHLRFE